MDGRDLADGGEPADLPTQLEIAVSIDLVDGFVDRYLGAEGIPTRRENEKIHLLAASSLDNSLLRLIKASCVSAEN